MHTKLWTVTVNYAATCEGVTLMAFVCYAEDENRLKDKFLWAFRDAVDCFYNMATIEEGFNDKNEVVQYLASQKQIDAIKRAVWNANIEWSASLHLNYS